MLSSFPLTVYCISLVSFQQLLALPVGAKDKPESSRLDLLQKLQGQKDEATTPQENGVELASASDSRPSSVQPPAKWPPGFLRVTGPTDKKPSKALAWAQGAVSSYTQQRVQRSRRHAGSRGGLHHPHHAQLMRVGCVLGTCQVQNLSHRLYQLIGQSGREDSSPIHPRSPHSYG